MPIEVDRYYVLVACESDLLAKKERGGGGWTGKIKRIGRSDVDC